MSSTRKYENVMKKARNNYDLRRRYSDNEPPALVNGYSINSGNNNSSDINGNNYDTSIYGPWYMKNRKELRRRVRGLPVKTNSNANNSNFSNTNENKAKKTRSKTMANVVNSIGMRLPYNRLLNSKQNTNTTEARAELAQIRQQRVQRPNTQKINQKFMTSSQKQKIDNLKLEKARKELEEEKRIRNARKEKREINRQSKSSVTNSTKSIQNNLIKLEKKKREREMRKLKRNQELNFLKASATYANNYKEPNL